MQEMNDKNYSVETQDERERDGYFTVSYSKATNKKSAGMQRLKQAVVLDHP